MAKDPSPRADMLRAQREARYGHLQATADPPTDQGIGPWVNGTNRPPKSSEPKPTPTLKPAKRKLIPYAGKANKGVAPKGSVPPPSKPRKPKKETT